MNDTVRRLKRMFDEEAARLDALRREANCDALTGLANRNHFMARLGAALQAEDTRSIGLILVRIADLAGINHRLGREATDELLSRLAAVLREEMEKQPDSVAARLNGADFALLVTGQLELRPLAERLLARLLQQAAAYVGDAALAGVGMGVFPHGADSSMVLAQTDAALAAAEAEGGNAIREVAYETSETWPQSAEEWARLIRQALDRKRVKLAAFPVTDFQHRLVHRECPLRLMFEEGENGCRLAVSCPLPSAWA